MNKNIEDTLIPLLRESIKDFNLNQDLDSFLQLDIPTSGSFGDCSSNIALVISKKIKKKPFEVAQSIVKKLKDSLGNSCLKDYINEIKVEGAGFINLYFKDRYFYDELKNIIASDKDFAKHDIGKARAVLVEFVSANPTGPLSVAHARQAAVGDALANILNFLGFSVKKEYYLNDEGNQINILGDSIRLRLEQLGGKKVEFPENYYQGEYIVSLAKNIKENNLKIDDFSEYGANEILKIIKKELDDFGVKFDCWYSQKELRKSGKISKVLEFLKTKGMVYEKEGAWWFKSSQFSDDKDRVVVKSDASYTYLAPDIAYHKDKFQRGFEWLINLWGPDHHGYIERLKAAVEALGHSPDCLSIIIVQLATISRKGKPVEMSTRSGQYISLREVLDEVGRDAARFFFMMRKTSSHLNFDLEIAKKQTAENPVYYVQYAYARINSILRQADFKIKPVDINFSLLKEKEEMILIKKLWQFSGALRICLKTEDPYMLTVYLQELAESFHKFYDSRRVLGQDKNLTEARLALLYGTQIVLSCGLDLLGISKPEKM